MRISFFLFSFLFFFFGMRNHYSKYEITKGSCPRAPCRREKDGPASVSRAFSKTDGLATWRTVPRAFGETGVESEGFEERNERRGAPVPSFPSRHGASRGKTYDKMSTEKKAGKEKP